MQLHSNEFHTKLKRGNRRVQTICAHLMQGQNTVEDATQSMHIASKRREVLLVSHDASCCLLMVSTDAVLSHLDTSRHSLMHATAPCSGSPSACSLTDNTNKLPKMLDAATRMDIDAACSTVCTMSNVVRVSSPLGIFEGWLA